MSGRKNIPAPPLRPMTAFFLWRNENYDTVKEELISTYGQLKGLTLSKKIGIMWKKLDEKAKDKYQKQSQKLQEKYEEDCDDYIRTYGERTMQKKQRSRAMEKSKRQSKSQQKSKSKAKSTKGCKGC